MTQIIKLSIFIPVLCLSACGGDDAPSAALDGLPVNTIPLVSIADIRSDLKQYKRASDVSATDAEAALTFLGKDGEWDSVESKNGIHIFSNLTADEMVIGSAEVHGLRMLSEEIPFADYVVLKNISVEDVMTIDRAEFSLPDSAMIETLLEAQKIAEEERAKNQDQNVEDWLSYSGGPTADQIASIDLLRNFSGAGFFQGFEASPEDDAEFKVEFMGWTKEGRTISLLLSNLEFRTEDSYDSPDLVSVETVSIKNYRLSDAPVTGGGFMLGFSYVMGGYLNFLNPLNRNFDALSSRNIRVEYEDDGMTGQVPSGDIWYEDAGDGGHYMVFNVPEGRYDFTQGSYRSEIDPFDMTRLGLNPMIFSYGAKIKANPVTDMMHMEQGGLHIQDNIRLEFTYKMEGFNALLSAMNSGMFMGTDEVDPVEEAMQNLAVRGFSLELTDLGLMERGMDFAASEQGMSVDEVRDMAKSGITMSTMAASSDYQAELAQGYIETLSAFIDEGGTFKMVADPDDGLARNELAFPYGAMAPSNPFAPPKPEDSMEIVDKWLRNLNIRFEHAAD